MADFLENIARRRMLALAGDTDAINAFQRRGITLQQVRNLTEDELLLQVCRGIATRSGELGGRMHLSDQNRNALEPRTPQGENAS